MNGVELPEYGIFVGPAMRPVSADLTDEHGGSDADPDRKGGDLFVVCKRNEVVEGGGEGGERENEQEFGNDGVEKVIGEVGEEGGAEDFLGMECEKPFHGNENDHQEHEPGAETKEIACESRQLGVHFHQPTRGHM
jgi:hypothetical protein